MRRRWDRLLGWAYHRIPRRVRCAVGWHTVAFHFPIGPMCIDCGKRWMEGG